jgi:ABC-2 type transport system ATP-binding protein
MLIAESLSKTFGPVRAVDGVSFRVAPGEIVGLLGPNGAGKSTTIRMLAGCLAPDAGRVTVEGRDLTADPAARVRLGYAPEEPPLYDDMRTEDYLVHIARLKGIPAGARRAAAAAAIAAVALQANAKRRLGVLSKGNRQRAALAQALLGDPAALLLDEPTNGLDPAQVANLRDLLRGLAARHAVLLSTHVLGEVDALCTRVVVIHKGRVLADEPIERLRDRAKVTRVRIRLRDGAPETLVAALPAGATGMVDAGCAVIDAPPDLRPALVVAAEGNGGLRELVEERRSLEEVFRDLIAGA